MDAAWICDCDGTIISCVPTFLNQIAKSELEKDEQMGKFGDAICHINSLMLFVQVLCKSRA